MACVFTLLLQSSYLFFYFRGLVVQVVVYEHTAKLNTRTHTRDTYHHTQLKWTLDLAPFTVILPHVHLPLPENTSFVPDYLYRL